jgi:hypothetical protein
MKKSTFAFHGSVPAQGKVNYRDNIGSEDRSVSQICVINLSLGRVVTSIIVGERIFSMPHRVWAGCGVYITFFQWAQRAFSTSENVRGEVEHSPSCNAETQPV